MRKEAAKYFQTPTPVVAGQEEKEGWSEIRTDRVLVTFPWQRCEFERPSLRNEFLINLFRLEYLNISPQSWCYRWETSAEWLSGWLAGFRGGVSV